MLLAEGSYLAALRSNALEIKNLPRFACLRGTTGGGGTTGERLPTDVGGMGGPNSIETEKDRPIGASELDIHTCSVTSNGLGKTQIPDEQKDRLVGPFRNRLLLPFHRVEWYIYPFPDTQ